MVTNASSDVTQKWLREGGWKVCPQRCHQCEWIGFPDTEQTCDMCRAQHCLSLVLPEKTCQNCGWHGHPKYLQVCRRCTSVDTLIPPEEGFNGSSRLDAEGEA